MEEKTIYSYHAFLFPFRWEKTGRIDINEAREFLETAGWEYTPFAIATEQDYNEFVYFYEYARDAIYNTEQEFKPNQTTYHFNYSINDGKYIIKIKEREEPFELHIESVSLKLYETGVAILSLQMENRTYPAKEDVKLINDFGRRTYPQYLPLEAVRGSFLSEFIAITGAGLKWKEDFSEYDGMNFDISENQNPAYLPKFIKGLLGDNFSDNKNDRDKIFVDPVIDDRMFTVCWYGNDEEAERLTQFNVKEQRYEYERDYFWHELLFIDAKEATCQSKTMLQKLLREHTYNRWARQGTLFGITRYSFVLITKRGWFPENVLLKHIKTMYHQLAILTLAQRASILNFSKRVTVISKMGKNITESVARLHKDYLRFVNKMYFDEVTAQEQGIELYDLMLRFMRIKENIKDLDNEIKELHDYAELEQDKKTNRAIHIITLIGLYVLLPTFVTGFFGMNILNRSWIVWNEQRPWMLGVYFGGSLVLAALFHWIIHITNKKMS